LRFIMFSQISKRLHCLAIGMIVVQAYAPLMVQAKISDMPPLLKNNVPPNIVFTLDDSGSMQWDAVPDSMTYNGSSADADGNRYGSLGYPTPKGIYRNGALDWGQTIGFGSDLKVAQYRSSTLNAIYYNPEIVYSPWIDAAGNNMAAANPAAAKFTPINPSDNTSTLPVIDLTAVTTACAPWTTNADTSFFTVATACTLSGSGSTSNPRNFYPATYFVYNPDNLTTCTTSTLACFKRIEVKSGMAAIDLSKNDGKDGKPKRKQLRTDCGATTCTYAQEIQNFANWFQYARSRILLSRGGVGTAFSKQGTAIRVGYGAINTSGTVAAGVSSDFSGTNRSGFFNYLYTHVMPSAGTPLRKAVDEVGQYFQETDANGPWQNIIGDSGSGQASCRQNYHILMTDGFWNGSGASGSAAGNHDNTDGVLMTSSTDTTFKYKAVRPYAAGASDTLADVAMYYWKTDLRPDWAKAKKNVPTTSSDPAFWQHLVHFTVGLGVKGTLDPAVDLPDLISGAKSWSVPAADSLNNVDDLWHAAVNSRGEYFSAANPIQFADALDSALDRIAERSGSAAAVGTSSKSIGSGVKLYTSTYETTAWTGKLTQFGISGTGALGASDWDSDNKIPAEASRLIFTSNDTGNGGLEFKYASLNTVDKSIFDTKVVNYASGFAVTGEKIVNYLRGDETNKRASPSDVTKPFRARAKFLGDLVNSDPLYLKEGLDARYAFLPSSAAGGSGYDAFLATKKSREATVYVGSNDGMLHAFDVSTTSGLERFAFVPRGVYANLPALASPDYKHAFYVDGSPQAGDAYIGGAWKTILLGTTGAGGKSVYALDVTNISGTNKFNAGNVLWERNSTTHTDGDAAAANDMGFTIGNPQIGRLRDDTWVAIYGNGYDSVNQKAILYVVNLATGNLIAKIDTGVGSTTAKNGLSTPKLLIGADSTIMAAYAGDLQGNLWKFDFSSPTTGAIVPKLAFGTNALFTTPSAQAITTQPQIYRHPNGGYIVMFGTGKIFEDTDAITTPTQAVYGVWDKSDIPLVVADVITGGITKLQQQTMVSSSGYYVVSDLPINWATQRGWYVKLNVKVGERVVTDRVVLGDAVIFTTLIPGGSTDPCVFDGSSSILYLSPFNGGPLGYKTIDTDGDGSITAADTLVSGMSTSATLGNTILLAGNGKTISFTAPAIGAGVTEIKSSTGDPVPTVRLWQQLLNRQ
jgi:type IV pilus assembly protein PilY1